MSSNDFRRLAAAIDQYVQPLAAQGVTDPATILHRMLGDVPTLHRIWRGTSDAQLRALAQEFPGFHRYALILEVAAEAERRKPSRPYDGWTALSEADQQHGARLLTTAATLERGYTALRGGARGPGVRAGRVRAPGGGRRILDVPLNGLNPPNPS